MVGSLTSYLLRDPLPRFAERRSSLAEVMASPSTIEDGYVYTPARLVATSGLAVDLVVRRAVEDTGRTLPLAVILGGHLTGREAARKLGGTHGVVIAAVSYPFHGDPRPDAATFLREIHKIRAAFLDTPPALMLALDYLLRLPGVDGEHVEAIGVSLGAPFVVVAGALDPRFARVWSIHGSGGSYAPLEMNMRRAIRFAPVRVAAAATAAVIIAGPRLDPSRWVERIAPRRFMMVSALDDERMPRAQIQELFRSAREPKEQIWMSGAHVHGDSATIARLVGIVMRHVREAPPAADTASQNRNRPPRGRELTGAPTSARTRPPRSASHPRGAPRPTARTHPSRRSTCCRS
jgi:dienelactone hydrolase